MTNNRDANKTTRDFFDSILLEERLIDSVSPNMEINFFSNKFAYPIFSPAYSHQKDAMLDYAKLAKEFNFLHFVGMCENDEFEKISSFYNKICRIIKPYKNKDKIFSQIDCAVKCGSIAVGIDIDHSFDNKGNNDTVLDEEMSPKSFEELVEIINYCKIPFIIKGVLSVTDAAKALKAGASAIIVSHHHGRMPYAVPPIRVLSEIKEATKDQMKIIVDCGINSGADAYKALALGADAVLYGRDLRTCYREKGYDGLKNEYIKMINELSMLMAYTGVKDTKSFDCSVLKFSGDLI